MRRVVVNVYHANGPATGTMTVLPPGPWTGYGTVVFAPDVIFDLGTLVREAGRRSIEVLAEVTALGSGIDPADASHRAHLAAVARYLLDTVPNLGGISLAGLDAPGQADDVTALVGEVAGAVASRGKKLAMRVGAVASDTEAMALRAGRGQDILAIAELSDTLYLETFVNEDADGDGLPDHDPGWPGEAVSYLAEQSVSTKLVPLLPTYDVMEAFEDTNGNGRCDPGEPFADVNGDGTWGTLISMTPDRLRAVISGLPSEGINGIAIYRNAETSTDEWDAIVEGAAR